MSAGRGDATAAPGEIPRSAPERLAALDALWWAVSVDTTRTADRLRELGWPEEDLDDAMVAYEAWLAERLVDAVAVGLLAAGVGP